LLKFDGTTFRGALITKKKCFFGKSARDLNPNPHSARKLASIPASRRISSVRLRSGLPPQMATMFGITALTPAIPRYIRPPFGAA